MKTHAVLGQPLTSHASLHCRDGIYRAITGQAALHKGDANHYSSNHPCVDSSTRFCHEVLGTPQRGEGKEQELGV